MEFFVNNEKLDITLQDETTVGDVLKAFEISCQENHLATIGIILNGKEIPAENFDSILDTPLEDTTKIEVSVISELAIKENFKELSKDFSNLIDLLKQIPIEMQSGKDANAKQTIIKLSDVMNSFCSLLTWSSLFPETFENITIDQKTIPDFLADLSQILSDFKGALENSDSVLIGDLAEYEICPRLELICKTLDNL